MHTLSNNKTLSIFCPESDFKLNCNKSLDINKRAGLKLLRLVYRLTHKSLRPMSLDLQP